MKRIFLIFILLLSLNFARMIELENINIIYDITRHGNVRVTEELTYNLKGCEYNPFNELYREIPPGLRVSNAYGYCTNTRCNFRYDTHDRSISGSNELIVELTEQRCGEIDVRFDYDIYPMVMTRDVTQFFYKIWGEKNPGADVNIKIIFPEQIFTEEIKYAYVERNITDEFNETQTVTRRVVEKNESVKNIIYFIHKEDERYEVKEYGNTLEINSQQKAKEMLEINLLMPKEWFVENNNFIYRKDIGKQDIIEEEERDEIYRSYKWILDLILLILFIIYLIVPFLILGIIYYIYGKEFTPGEVNYSNIYEREIPSKHSPAEAIFFVKGDEDYSNKERGNAIVATIMSFVNKGIADIEERGKEVYLKFNYKKMNENELQKYEIDLLEFIKKEFGNKEFNIKDFEKKSSKKVEYYQLVNKFFMRVSKVNKNSVYVENHGNQIGYISLLIYLLITFFIFLFEPFAFLGILFGVASIYIMKYKKIMLAKWTEEGRVLNLKWENFRKYITDYSLMKEHPPESVKLWDEYLTYSIALGVADKTLKAMKKLAPQQVHKNTHSVAHVYLVSGMSLRMSRAFTPNYTSPSASSMGGYSGSIGGFGGGMGGGGFGGR